MFEIGDQVKLVRGEKVGTIIDVDLAFHTPYCVLWNDTIDTAVQVEWHYGHELQLL